LAESHQLNPWPLDEGPTQKWIIEAKPTWHHFEGKINWFKPQIKKTKILKLKLKLNSKKRKKKAQRRESS
jgi:hypothetical protein